jgi:putative ABC transport system permease protein
MLCTEWDRGYRAEYARDTAILKALGMAPREVILMVLTSVAIIGVVGAAVALPEGMVLHRQILTTMGKIAASTAIPSQFYAVFPIAILLALAFAGLAVALGGALLPATWAARSRISSLLSPE